MTATSIVALVEDDEDLRAATGQLLRLAGMTVLEFAEAKAALAAIQADFAGIVVSDVRMPGMSGIELFRALHDRDAELPVVLVTGHADVATAVDALKAGAWDFLTKPFDAGELTAAVTRAARARGLALENRRLRAMAEATGEAQLIGESSAIRQLRAMLPMLAQSDLDLVIEGETGTGKELYARLVHRAGRRARHRFGVVDCATVPPSIVERELFVAGGIVARANRGTLFLDNLDAASGDLQHRLAQLAEARAVALESRDPQPVDVRIIAAIGAGRQAAVMPALYHRLAGVPLTMPPLADRQGDVPLLLAHFLAQAAKRHRVAIPGVADIAERLRGRAWPGNVRELEKMADRLCLGVGQEDIGEPPVTAPAPLPERLDRFERAAIIEAIAATRGEVAAAIELLRIPRKTFYYRVKRLEIDLVAERAAAARAPL